MCQSCGTSLTQNPYAAPTAAGGLPPAGGPPRQIENYLVHSILVTLCCCLPLGIVGIVYAAQVNGFVAAGNMAAAQNAADTAKMWCWWGFGLGIVANVIGILIQVMLLSAQRGAAF